jgi:hypothetical protein
MAATTPTGWRTTSELPTRSSKATPATTWGSAENVITGRPTWIMVARSTGIPTSSARRAPISVMRAWSPSPTRASTAARSAGSVAAHASPAARAASTAPSASPAPAAGTVAHTSSVAGLWTSMTPSPSGRTHWPPT